MTDSRQEQERHERQERERQEKERRKLEERSRDNEATIMRTLAFEAGRQLAEIPREAKGNVPALEGYRDGLNEAKKTLGETSQTQRLDREVDRAIIEAQQIREAVKRELGRADDFHRHAEAGETYRGRVIGRTNSYVIQADETSYGRIVLHERAAVSGAEKVKMNDHAEISYPYGRAGIVRNPQAVQHQRQRQMEKTGAGREHGR